MDYYYKEKSGHEVGPLSRGELRAFRTGNVINDETSIRTSDSDRWESYAKKFGVPPVASNKNSSATKLSLKQWLAIGAIASLATLFYCGSVLADAVFNDAPKPAVAISAIAATMPSPLSHFDVTKIDVTFDKGSSPVSGQAALTLNLKRPLYAKDDFLLHLAETGDGERAFTNALARRDKLPPSLAPPIPSSPSLPLYTEAKAPGFQASIAVALSIGKSPRKWTFTDCVAAWIGRRRWEVNQVTWPPPATDLIGLVSRDELPQDAIVWNEPASQEALQAMAASRRTFIADVQAAEEAVAQREALSRTALQQARDAFAAGHFEDSRKSLGVALQSKPDDPAARDLLKEVSAAESKVDRPPGPLPEDEPTAPIIIFPEIDGWSNSSRPWTDERKPDGLPNEKGGRSDERLRVGGYSDMYLSYLRFVLPQTLAARNLRSARLVLWSVDSDESTPTAIAMSRSSRIWQPIARSGRFLWRDRPNAVGSVNEVPATMRGGGVEIELTETVRSWLANRATNQGVLLSPATTRKDYTIFHSSRSAQAEKRPHLSLLMATEAMQSTPTSALPLTIQQVRQQLAGTFAGVWKGHDGILFQRIITINENLASGSDNVELPSGERLSMRITATLNRDVLQAKNETIQGKYAADKMVISSVGNGKAIGIGLIDDQGNRRSGILYRIPDGKAQSGFVGTFTGVWRDQGGATYPRTISIGPDLVTGLDSVGLLQGRRATEITFRSEGNTLKANGASTGSRISKNMTLILANGGNAIDVTSVDDNGNAGSGRLNRVR